MYDNSLLLNYIGYNVWFWSSVCQLHSADTLLRPARLKRVCIQAIPFRRFAPFTQNTKRQTECGQWLCVHAGTRAFLHYSHENAHKTRNTMASLELN